MPSGRAPDPTETDRPIGVMAGLVFASVLALAASLLSAVAASIDVPHASWAILTLFVVAQPSFSDTFATALTVVVVLSGSTSTDELTATDGYRVLCTTTDTPQRISWPT